MRKILVLCSMLLLLQLTSVVAQTMADYILETKGDTLVVKDEFDFGAPDALTQLLAADTLNVPAGRVYQLHANGYYSVINRPTSSATVRAIIAGDNNALIKNSQSDAIPIITGAVYDGGSSKGGLNSGYDLIVKNVNINSGNSAATQGDWTFFGINPVGGRLEVDNCLIEHNIWVEIQPQQMQRIFWKNDYFVNLSGHTCRRNGGVVDFNSNATVMDTLWVENCTHVMTQGSLYKYRDGYKTNKSVYNHNDFINCAGFVFMNRGSATNISITNNIFVNCNVQPMSPILKNADNQELDPDLLPMGFVNVCPDSAGFKAPGGGHFYVDKNLVYWDPKLTDVVPSALNAAAVNGATDWVSQMITMNSRTQAAFDNDAAYPYLVEGTWFEKLPAFANTASLFTTQLDNIIDYVKICVDTTSTQALPYWREVFTASTDFAYSDWPIPIDLSYTDTDLLTGGLGGFPVGDLNWFPTQYASWKAQASTEYANIQNVLDVGTDVKQVEGLPVSYKLDQNYPNPFNPTTVINFTIPKAGNVTLKVYNALGQEVATLLDEYKDASNYQVNFNASMLSSGIYFYTLKVNEFTQTKKMMLVK